VNLPAKVAAAAGAFYLVAAPVQAYCPYPAAAGTEGLTFAQIPNLAPDGVIAAVQVRYRQDRFGRSLDDAVMPMPAASPAIGSRCKTEFGSKTLPLGPAMPGGACGFSLSDGRFAEGIVAE
jgi:hypothetical protein